MSRSTLIWRGLPPVGEGNRHALLRDQLCADGVDAQVVELLFGQGIAAYAHLQNGHVGRAVLQNQRRRGSRGEATQQGLADGRDLGYAR